MEANCLSFMPGTLERGGDGGLYAGQHNPVIFTGCATFEAHAYGPYSRNGAWPSCLNQVRSISRNPAREARRAAQSGRSRAGRTEGALFTQKLLYGLHRLTRRFFVGYVSKVWELDETHMRERAHVVR